MYSCKEIFGPFKNRFTDNIPDEKFLRCILNGPRRYIRCIGNLQLFVCRIWKDAEPKIRFRYVIQATYYDFPDHCATREIFYINRIASIRIYDKRRCGLKIYSIDRVRKRFISCRGDDDNI